MDLLAPCRSCLQCLPFFHVSPPSSPRPPAATSTGPSSNSAQEAASKASTTSDPGEYTQSLAAAPALAEGQLDLPTSAKEEEPDLLSYSRIENQAIAENESNPMSEIIIAPPVSSPPNKYTAAATYEEGEPSKTTTASTQLPLHVPFINDISFSISGLMPLPSPMTPAPFGAGYMVPAGLHHPSPHIYPPANDDSHDSNGHSQHAHDNSHVEHVSHDEQGPLHHVYDDDGHQGHSSSSHGDSHSHQYVHGLPDESHAHEAPDETHDTSAGTLETFNSTPGYLDPEAKQDGDNGATGDTGGDSALIETYHSEPIVLAGVAEEDDSYTPEEGLNHSASHMGRRRRRRDHFKDQFKGISEQIKHGGLHLKEEGSKHLQTIISNMNKQAQQVEQSGSFYMVPRANNN